MFFVSRSCPLCKRIVPQLPRIAATYGSRVKLLAVCDKPDSDARAGRFVRDIKNMGITSIPATAEVGNVFGVSAYPYGFLVNEAGTLVGKGMIHSASDIDGYLSEIPGAPDTRAQEVVN